MTARSLVEGLFGILPDALKGELVIKPGFPAAWNNASINIPDIAIDFKRKGKEDVYTIIPAFEKKMRLKLLVKANGSGVQAILINGKKVAWKNVADAMGSPVIEISSEVQSKYVISINWLGSFSTVAGQKSSYINGDKLDIQFAGATIQTISDPQSVLQSAQKNNDKLNAVISATKGSYTFFVQLKQNELSWWQPVNIVVKNAVEIISSYNQSSNFLFQLINNTGSTLKGKLLVNSGDNAYAIPMELDGTYTQGNLPNEYLIPGSNVVSFSWDGNFVHKNIVNWRVESKSKTLQALDISRYFNDKVTNIFKNQYLSPRPNVATLQLPTQGIGDWTHPLKTANIDDKGLRKLAGELNRIVLPQGISFSTPSDTLQSNILFTSQWNNYPKEAIVPLTGKASHAYLLMTGSTNPMQSRLVNGAIIISYTDNTADTLLLKNPETWWPIEQDYLDDGFAFTIDAARPVRIHLKTGKIVSDFDNSIEAYEGKMIDGGAATVLDMPLNRFKTLKELKLQTIANDVVIGLMAITLVRE
jgi:hypothetical protein